MDMSRRHSTGSPLAAHRVSLKPPQRL
jgi:hypothetical protein